jgi:GT2 family glycosyltransferase
MPAISVVILSYNKFAATTGPCLKSIQADPGHAKWNVVVVDNASDAQTQECLSQAKESYPAMDLVRNPTNLGFPGGMNVGLRRSDSDVTVLLNSDTRVAPGMVDALASALAGDPQLGIVGPVSNAAGNEQKICCSPGEPEAILRQGSAYATSGPPIVVPAYRLDFCCVALSRPLMDKVGLLDEVFGRGYYEDFDYCLRAQQQGFCPSVVENAFLYHQGGASFASVSQQTRELIKRNKRLLFRKHGSHLRMPHVREGNLAVLAHYAQMPAQDMSAHRQRIANRLQLAELEMPRSFIKRWRYRRTLRIMEDRFVDAGLVINRSPASAE